jgi:hypothetical protein
MDWIWTDTSLVLDEWSLMEDIFVNLYERKCELKLDEEFPEPRGKAKRRFFKYLLGGAWVILIIGLSRLPFSKSKNIFSNIFHIS